MSASLLLLIDGYNVIGPVAAPGGRRDSMWLHRERMGLLNRLAKRLPTEVCDRTCVVFDAASPPRDRPSRYRFQGIDVRFAVDYAEADDLLEEIIAAHHSPKRLSVVSSDHRIQTATSRRGGRCFDSQAWLDRLIEGEVQLVAWPRNTTSKRAEGRDHGLASERAQPTVADAAPDREKLPPDEVQQWLEEFQIQPEDTE